MDLKKPILSTLILLAITFVVLGGVSAIPVGPSFINVTSNTTIQAAINAANPGDTLNIAAGTYREQLIISKNLTLIGAGENLTTIQAPFLINGDSNGAKSIITINGSGVNVDLSGFKVSGPGAGPCGSINAGIFVRDGAYARIHDNTVLDIRDSPLSGCQNGVGIFVGRNLYSTSGSATIEDNIVLNYQKGGIVVDGSNSNAIISGNEVFGVGTTTLIASNGIQVSRGAYGNVTGNVVSGNDYLINSTGQDCSYPVNLSNLTDIYNKCSTAAGILFYGANISSSAQYNIVKYNGEGIYVDTNISGVNYNLISLNRYFGIDDNFDNNGNTNTIFILNAANNYYETVSPVQSLNPQADVTPQVTYSPWYASLDRQSLGFLFEVTPNTDGNLETAPSLNEFNISSYNMTVEIPVGTTITGNTSWDGTINSPTLVSLANVSASVQSLVENIVNNIPNSQSHMDPGSETFVKIGSDQSPLTFSNKIIINLSGMGVGNIGVGYLNSSSDRFVIINSCGTNTTNECWSIPSGTNDLIILTNHFTQFVTYTTSHTTINGPGPTPVAFGGGGGGAAPATTTTTNTNNNSTSGTTLNPSNPTSTPQATTANGASPITGNAVNNAPITGGVIGALTSTWGIVIIALFVVVLITVISVSKSSRKRKERLDKYGY